jgi:transposase-like protein
LCHSGTIKKSAGTLLEANREVGVDINTGKTRFLVVSFHQNAQQNHNLLVANKSIENVSMFRYLGTIVTN